MSKLQKIKERIQSCGCKETLEKEFKKSIVNNYGPDLVIEVDNDISIMVEGNKVSMYDMRNGELHFIKEVE